MAFWGKKKKKKGRRGDYCGLHSGTSAFGIIRIRLISADSSNGPKEIVVVAVLTQGPRENWNRVCILKACLTRDETKAGLISFPKFKYLALPTSYVV